MLGSLLAGLACASAQAQSTEPSQASGAPQAPSTAAPPATAADSAPQPDPPSRPVAGLGAPLKQEQLAGSRGGTDTAISEARLNATVTNNTAQNVSSGNNTIDSGSFANMSGLPMVIQNSGSNVLIQNATVINLQLR